MDGTADHTVLIGVLAAGTAILAAMIAATSADIRQRRQLKEDRQLQDLTELRSVLDDAAVALEQTIHHLQWVFVGFDRTAEQLAEGDEEVKKILERGFQEEFNKNMQACADGRDSMMIASRRLAIRVGEEQALHAAYQNAVNLVIDCIHDIHAGKREQDAGGQVSSEAFEGRNLELAGLRRLFVTQAVAHVGSRLPAQRP